MIIVKVMDFKQFLKDRIAEMGRSDCVCGSKDTKIHGKKVP